MRIMRDKLFGFDPDRLAEIGDAFKDDPIGYALLQRYFRLKRAEKNTDRLLIGAGIMLVEAVRAFMIDNFPDDTSANSVRKVSDYLRDATLP